MTVLDNTQIDGMHTVKLKSGGPAMQYLLDKLVQLAVKQGAGGAVSVSTTAIVVEERPADLCRDPGCENYGLSASCPPHVAGSAGFRKLLTQFDHAVFFKIDVPTEILLSEERRYVFKLFHETAARIEQAAVDRGCPDARAFAGGSCRKIFCLDQPDCQVVQRGGPCRHPNHARPSMSGQGINVSRLMKTAGWKMAAITRDTAPDAVPMGSVSGLVLIG